MMADFSGLKEKLEAMEWPAVYLFKFIVLNDQEKIARVTALFEEAADLNLQPSSNGKYISISAKELMISPEAIISRYEKASEIEGIISL